MRIESVLTNDFGIKVSFFEEPTKPCTTSLLFYGIIRAMKQHNEDAFTFAMNKFISEEIDEMMGDEEDDKRKS